MYRAVGTLECKGAQLPLQILADQLTLLPSDYTKDITTCPSGFSNLLTALNCSMSAGNCPGACVPAEAWAGFP